MNNTNFTPGPWGTEFVAHTVLGSKTWGIVSGSKDLRIAVVGDKRDADLIASAPDLLLHLQGFVAHCSLFHEHEFEEMIKEAKKVIAQAKGE